MKPKVNAADLAPDEPLYCGTCGDNPATHEVHIRVQRGFDYMQAKQLYSVTYAICAQCAQQVLVVKLGAELNRAGTRR